MLDTLSEKFQDILKTLRGHHRISEANIQAALREIRKTLLEADVNYAVVKRFINAVREKALDTEVLRNVTPGQMITKILHDEMVALLADESASLDLGASPRVLLMVGLQGCGKTTTTAKLASWFREKGLSPLLAACDTRRPAAREQLRVLAEQGDCGYFTLPDEKDPARIAEKARDFMRSEGRYNRLILDTGGRLHVDRELMEELERIAARAHPHEILLTADAMTGQDAVKTARTFNEHLDLSGVVLTKMDGDARGGAVLSMTATIGKPVKFVGVGEKIENFEFFHPDRMASRILGMGDIVSLVEKAQKVVDEKEAEKLREKFKKSEFDFDDFLMSIRKIRKMGSLQNIFKMLPGMPRVNDDDLDEGQLVSVESIINSMTPGERRKPGILNGSRKKRIARGSGRSVEDVNRLLKQYREMRTMMKRMRKMVGKGGMRNMPFGM
jgi:signal recognition particle subunit SRP54